MQRHPGIRRLGVAHRDQAGDSIEEDGDCGRLRGIDASSSHGHHDAKVCHHACGPARKGTGDDSGGELNDVNLRKWLRNPPGQKPMDPENGQGMPNLGLSEDEITQLIAYLETLK